MTEPARLVLHKAARAYDYDAVVVGGGPNGLSAGVTLAQAGLSTLLVEADAELGGGARTQALTLPGFEHDVCSAVHPLGLASPLFQQLGLERYGLSWIQPSVPLAHVLGSGQCVTLARSIEATVAQFPEDAERYERLVQPFVEQFTRLSEGILGPLRLPRHPWLLARFGLLGLRSLAGLVQTRFRAAPLRALLAGVGAHATLPLDAAGSAAFALVLAVSAHAAGWPIARGGSRALSQALAARFRALGGVVMTGLRVEQLSQLPAARAYLFDTGPRQLVQIAAERLPSAYASRLQRFRYGPGVFKLDWALDAPIPWRDPVCAQAGTVHLSGNLEDIARSEAAIHAGSVAQRPFIILTQPSLFDPTRAPEGKHVAWAYCHVPHASAHDMTDAIESEIERAAPGFRKLILARSARGPLALERHNPNQVGGDINGGSTALNQLFFRPLISADPYATPARDLYLCSASTPPGGGVHGMCGYWAARSALRRVFAVKHVAFGQ